MTTSTTTKMLQRTYIRFSVWPYFFVSTKTAASQPSREHARLWQKWTLASLSCRDVAESIEACKSSQFRLGTKSPRIVPPPPPQSPKTTRTIIR
eukprot:3985634-Amphidinium_carterae.1